MPSGSKGLAGKAIYTDYDVQSADVPARVATEHALRKAKLVLAIENVI